MGSWYTLRSSVLTPVLEKGVEQGVYGPYVQVGPRSGSKRYKGMFFSFQMPLAT